MSGAVNKMYKAPGWGKGGGDRQGGGGRGRRRLCYASGMNCLPTRTKFTDRRWLCLACAFAVRYCNCH